MSAFGIIMAALVTLAVCGLPVLALSSQSHAFREDEDQFPNMDSNGDVR